MLEDMSETKILSYEEIVPLKSPDMGNPQSQVVSVEEIVPSSSEYGGTGSSVGSGSSVVGERDQVEVEEQAEDHIATHDAVCSTDDADVVPAASSEEDMDAVAEKVMDVLETYFWRAEDDAGIEQSAWPGRTKFKEHALHWIRSGKPVQATLPAFPFKSSNLDKVLGVLPDFGEYLGLARLNQMCEDIRKVYSLGAVVTIATDGAAFNDLLMISDADVWNYGQAVRQMVKDNGFNNIKVLHAMELLGFIGEDELTEENFYRTIDQCRELIKDQFCQGEDIIRKIVEEDPDSRLTYTGFKTFCKIDMENSPLRKEAVSRKAFLREISTLALSMMARSEGFGQLIRAVMPNHIRLSIHPSSGVAKLSICLIPQLPGSQARSPWMSCVAIDRNGAYHTAHTRDVRNTHDIVYENGRPWLYRERDSLSTSDFIAERNRIFDDLWQEHIKELELKPRSDITVTIDIGGDSPSITVTGKSWESTPASFLKDIPKGFSASVVIAKIDGELWDLNRPLEKDCTVTYVPFDSPEGQQVFWHSSAHCLGEACEQEFQCLLSHDEANAQGFFYDMATPEGRVVKEADWAHLDKKAATIFKERQTFDRLEVTKEDLMKMFAYNKYRLHYINDLEDGEKTTVYRSGTLVDLCRGPHIQNSGKIKAFKIMQNSSAYFLGDQANDSLQRIRGVAFPDKKLMQEHLKFLEEAEKGNHLRIGKDQELFFFDDVSPGSPFLLPHGTKIFNALQKLLRTEYRKRGYQEVQTPNMYDVGIWKTSGHWHHYKDDMFKLEKREMALKPMNCPGHFILFGHRDRSYRELPLRIADFGVLHRNEASGALSGLTRVRKFQQDDTHIFCMPEQITSEIEGLFDFIKSIYGLFGFTFKLKLSTRPDKYLGDLETWNYAEDQLRQALTNFRGDDWTVNPGDGAFYGPKIDITIADALKREFQCATIQLDYQAPINFNMEYVTNENGKTARPVVIHRAIIGSFERFLGILIEHFGGKWPFWISPRQILVIPVSPALNDYAEQVQRILLEDKLNVDVDVSGNTLQKKIRTGQLAQYNFIFVVGNKERDLMSVNIRNRDDPASQTKGVMMRLDEARVQLRALRKERRLVNAL